MARPSLPGFLAALVLLLLAVAPARAQPAPPLPSYAPLPAAFVPASTSVHDVAHWPWGELDLPKPRGTDLGGLKRGELWHRRLHLPSAGKPDAAGVTAQLVPAFLAKGWTEASLGGAHPTSTLLRYARDGRDAWLLLQIYDATRIEFDLVEVKPQPLAFALAAPAARPETIAPKTGNFPYLAPLPGAKLHDGNQQNGPLHIDLRAPDGHRELVLAGSGTIAKYYDLRGLTTVQFAVAYDQALTGAGWSIVRMSQSPHQSDAEIFAHYGRNGRDIWAYLHGTPDGFMIRVADAGRDDLAAAFAKDCHVALYGVLFDFDKATIKPESDAILTRVATLLAHPPLTKVEVQGHTDAVGSDSYNQTLSEARAAAVAAWLTAHGVAAGRLSSNGYGKRMPVAPNTSDEGRAKNRRVEIARPGCGK